MSRTSGRQDKDFEDLIKERIDLGDATWVLEWVAETFEPDSVFGEAALIAWAMDNGFAEERTE